MDYSGKINFLENTIVVMTNSILSSQDIRFGIVKSHTKTGELIIRPLVSEQKDDENCYRGDPCKGWKRCIKPTNVEDHSSGYLTPRWTSKWGWSIGTDSWFYSEFVNVYYLHKVPV